MAALRGGGLDLGAVGVGFGLLGAVHGAGAAVDGVADDLAGFGGEVGVAAPGAVEQGETCKDRWSCWRAARSSSPAVSTRARQRASTIGTWSTRTVCTVSTRKPSASAYASGRSRARSTSSRTFANPRSPDRNAFSVSGIARSPRATRISPATALRACSVRAATHPGPDWAPSAAHATRASHTPSSPTRPADSRFHATSSSTSSSDNAASGSSPGHSPVRASAAERIAATTRAAPEPPLERDLAGVVAIDHVFESTDRYRSIATPMTRKCQQSPRLEPPETSGPARAFDDDRQQPERQPTHAPPPDPDAPVSSRRVRWA